MKISVHAWLAWLTLLLVTITIMSAMNFSYSWIFWLTITGQGFLVYVVFKVLKDDYTTSLEFNDWYQDKPIPKEDQQDQ